MLEETVWRPLLYAHLFFEAAAESPKQAWTFEVLDLFLLIFIHTCNYSVISLSFSWEWVPWKPQPYFSVNSINEPMKSIMKTCGTEMYLKFISVWKIGTCQNILIIASWRGMVVMVQWEMVWTACEPVLNSVFDITNQAVSLPAS